MTQRRRMTTLPLSLSSRYLLLLVSCIAIIATSTVGAKKDDEFTVPLPDITEDLDRVTTTTTTPTPLPITPPRPTPPQPGPDTNYIAYGSTSSSYSFCTNSISNGDNTICCSNQCNGKCGGSNCCSHGPAGCSGCCAGNIQTLGRACEDYYDVECVIPQLLETGSPVVTHVPTTKVPSTDAPVIIITPVPTKIPTNEPTPIPTKEPTDVPVTTAPVPQLNTLSFDDDTDAFIATKQSASNTDPILLTPEQCNVNQPCNIENQQCTNGQTETCCNTTHFSFICDCMKDGNSGELMYQCYNTDACMIPQCGDGNGDGDGGFSTSQVDGSTESPVPTSKPTVKPTTMKPTTAKPTTGAPTTASPTTSKPTTSKPTTSSPTKPVIADNCYILSASKSQCELASNCEYTTDSSGVSVCKPIQPTVDNCYVLSTNESECKLAANCEWKKDSLGNTVCREIPGYTNAPTPAITSGNCTSADKEICKLATNCVWDKQLNTCTAGTESPTGKPTVKTNEPTVEPTVELRPRTFPPWRLDDEEPTFEPTPEPSFEPTFSPEREEDDTPRPTPRPTNRPVEPLPVIDTDDPTFLPTPTPSKTETNLGFLPDGTVDCKSLEKEACKISEESASGCKWSQDGCVEDPNVEPAKVDCTKFEKEVCREIDETICFWDKDECINVTPEPTQSPVTVAPTPTPPPQSVNCNDPNILQEVCKATVYCFWNKYQKTCGNTERPTRIPTPIPTPRPTKMPTNEPTPGVPTLRPTEQPSVSFVPSFSPTINPTVSHKPTISTSPTNSPTISFYPTLNKLAIRTELNSTVRFTPWNSLPRDVQIAASDELRYTKETWNNLGTNAIEYLRYEDLSDAQKEAARTIGFYDDMSWNCWQNHWESFSWKQLASRGLTQHLTSLGWGLDTWNDQYNDPPQTRKIAKWDDLSEEQRNDAMELCYYKTSWERLDLPTYGYGYPIARPKIRFTRWSEVNVTDRESLSQFLGYDEFTWNILRLNEVEQKGFFELVYFEKDVATSVLGLEEEGWDCWINHYDSYGWSDLVRRGLDVHWRGLGYTEESWNEEIDPPASEGKSWAELNEWERTHGTELCFNQETWDQIDMAENPGPFPFPKPKKRYTPWDDLTDEDREVAQILLYTPDTWNDMGLADIEKRAWNDLTEYQRPYAIQLELYERTWNCFQNHYRATKWGELSNEVRSAATALGWTNQKWLYGNVPELYGRDWNSLNKEQKEAAYVMRHHDVTWPGDGTEINLVNQNDTDRTSGATQMVGSISMLLLPAMLFVYVGGAIRV